MQENKKDFESNRNSNKKTNFFQKAFIINNFEKEKLNFYNETSDSETIL